MIQMGYDILWAGHMHFLKTILHCCVVTCCENHIYNILSATKSILLKSLSNLYLLSAFGICFFPLLSSAAFWILWSQICCTYTSVFTHITSLSLFCGSVKQKPIWEPSIEWSYSKFTVQNYFYSFTQFYTWLFNEL